MGLEVDVHQAARWGAPGQTAVAAPRDCAEVHKHVRASLDRDEAVALVAVEPLHNALRHLDLLVWPANCSAPGTTPLGREVRGAGATTRAGRRVPGPTRGPITRADRAVQVLPVPDSDHRRSATVVTTPSRRAVLSGEPARAAGVMAGQAEAAMGSGWHCTPADSRAGRTEGTEPRARIGLGENWRRSGSTRGPARTRHHLRQGPGARGSRSVACSLLLRRTGLRAAEPDAIGTVVSGTFGSPIRVHRPATTTARQA